MKTQAINHPKMKNLAMELGIRKREAVGIVELLIAMTSEYARQGDIGKLTNTLIAEYLDWDLDDADCLVDALIKTKWIDCHPDQNIRLVTHDWKTHAPEHIRKDLQRKGLEFHESPVGSCPDIVQTMSDENGTHSGQCRPTVPNPTQPNHTKPNPTKPQVGRGGAESFSKEDWDRLAKVKRFKLTGIEFERVKVMDEKQLAHLLDTVTAKGIRMPIPCAMSRGEDPPKENLRVIRKYLFPAIDGKCRGCGGELEKYQCNGTGERGMKCKRCKRDHPE